MKETKFIPIARVVTDERVYARSVTGRYNNWRWIMVWFTQLLFYGLPWVTWNGRQAVLFDLEARRFHIFSITFTPQDFILLALLLVICAFGLFLFTAVMGRVWCGYTCPQTVYTEIFQWIETRVEGDRSQRMRRDQGPRNAAWMSRKAFKHGLWLVVGLWTGFSFVGYFTPIRELGSEVIHLGMGPWESFWILFYGFATYGNAGWLREKICKYMCPYARFQGVMFDEHTLTATYDTTRGEPRGARSRKSDPAELGLGDCIDCSMCVQVCPTGIDIRDGLQYECINCGACIDACDKIMDHMGYERGLIRYGTDSGLSLQKTPREWLAKAFRPRIVVYTFLIWALIFVFIGGIWNHVPLRAEVVRDRAVMARLTEDGGIENLYQVQLGNTAIEPLELRLSVTGLPGIYLPEDERTATIDAESSTTLILHARLPADSEVANGTHEIEFHIESEASNEPITITADSPFVVR